MINSVIVKIVVTLIHSRIGILMLIDVLNQEIYHNLGC